MVVSCHRRKAGCKKSCRKNFRFPQVYAVASGRQPGPKIYRTLEEFKTNVVGHPGGIGKVFSCIKKARIWLSQFKDKKVTRDVITSLPPAPVDSMAAISTSHSLPQSTCSLLGSVTQSAFLKYVPSYDRMEGVEPLGVIVGSNTLALASIPESRPSLPQLTVKFGQKVLADDSLMSDSDATDNLKQNPSSISPSVQEMVTSYGKNLSTEQRKERPICPVSCPTRGCCDCELFKGTGKSLTLKSIIRMLRSKYGTHNEALAVTAPTGIAALNVGGETLHSFAGIGLGKKPIDELLPMVTGKTRDRWAKLKTLIIDEISMVDGIFFDKLEEIARYATRNKTELPFGGVQLVISGDFFQLPPVPDQYNGAPVPVCFAFEANSWRRCIAMQIRLTQVFRQADPGECKQLADPVVCHGWLASDSTTDYSKVFVDILNKMRLGKVDADLEIKLRRLERNVACTGVEPIHIYPRNLQVENENTSRLQALPGSLFPYDAVDRGRWIPFEMQHDAHQRRISNLLDKYSIAPRVAKLKAGAQVMLLRNLVPGQLVNGSLGRIVRFASVQDARMNGITTAADILEKTLEAEAKSTHRSLDELRKRRLPQDVSIPNDVLWPIVEFTNGQHVLLSPLPFDVEDAFGALEATRVQVPLMLAWAITVHKSQGQTIERLKIDLEGTFETGQAYVAISRSTGMDTLQVLNFKRTMVRAHPRVLEWYKELLAEEEMDREEAMAAYFSHC